jgi:hypothetical protein
VESSIKVTRSGGSGSVRYVMSVSYVVVEKHRVLSELGEKKKKKKLVIGMCDVLEL